MVNKKKQRVCNVCFSDVISTVLQWRRIGLTVLSILGISFFYQDLILFFGFDLVLTK